MSSLTTLRRSLPLACLAAAFVLLPAANSHALTVSSGLHIVSTAISPDDVFASGTAQVDIVSGGVIDSADGNDTALIRLLGSGQAGGFFLMFDDSELVIDGGDAFEIFLEDDSSASISGGTVSGTLEVAGNSTLDVSGGVIDDLITVFDTGSATITGGSIDSSLVTASANGTIDIFGGAFGVGTDLKAANDAVINIYGTSFNRAFGAISDPNGTIVGTLSDGSSIGVFFSRTSTATINLIAVPEPSPIALLGGFAVLALGGSLRRKSRRGALVAVLAGSFLAAPATAATIFEDQDFGPHWSTSFETVPGHASTGSSTIVATGGSSGTNPDPYFEVTTTLDTLSNVQVFLENSLATWDPGTDGAVSGVQFSIDARAFPQFGGGSQGQEVSGYILQGGTRYSVSFGFSGIRGRWERLTSPVLTANQFTVPFGTGGEPPLDFSAGGASMTFGFKIANSGNNGGALLDFVADYDNWSVTVFEAAVPEPGSAALLGLGALLLAVRAGRGRAAR